MSETNGHSDPSKLLSHTQQQAGGIRHLRRDCMDIAKMLSLGCLSQEKIQEYLEKTGELLGLNLDAKDSRAVKRLWDVLLSAAKLDQAERHKMLDKEVADKHEVSQSVAVQVYLPHNNRTTIDPEIIPKLNGHANGNGSSQH
jgi:hypothetical protein